MLRIPRGDSPHVSHPTLRDGAHRRRRGPRLCRCLDRLAGFSLRVRGEPVRRPGDPSGAERLLFGRREQKSAAGPRRERQRRPAVAQERKPNIVVIMGDDVGVWNIGAYHRGMMAGTDAEPRPAGLPGDAVHRLLRRGELHGRACQLHHRPAPHPHRHDDRRPGGLARSACRRRRRPSRRS